MEQLSLFNPIMPKKNNMKVLVACEESQRVCIAFREKGHEAYSCDLQECSGEHPEWHINGDCLSLLNGNCEFTTQDGTRHNIDSKWDLIVAHPPCTRLCVTGQRWLYFGDKDYREQKAQDQKEAIEFFMKFTDIDCDRVAIENPVGIMSKLYRPPNQIYNPYDFQGETDSKKTCLWLKGLPQLVANQELPKEKRTNSILTSHFDGKYVAWGTEECARMRSKTPWGVARAMAEQWG